MGGTGHRKRRQPDESSGTENSIQVSEAVYRVLKEKFRFRKRGVVDIKGIGAMETYYLLAPT